MKLNLSIFLVFRNPNQINWDATVEKIEQWAAINLPGFGLQAQQNFVNSIYQETRKKVNKIGTHNLYLELNRTNNGNGTAETD